MGIGLMASQLIHQRFNILYYIFVEDVVGPIKVLCEWRLRVSIQ